MNKIFISLLLSVLTLSMIREMGQGPPNSSLMITQSTVQPINEVETNSNVEDESDDDSELPTVEPTPLPETIAFQPLLVGSNWELESLNGIDVNDVTNLDTNANASDVIITARFQERDVTGLSGCNNYAASYQATKGDISIGTAAVSQRACVPELEEQERRYLSALEGATRYRVTSSGELEIDFQNANESGTLEFRADETTDDRLNQTTWELFLSGTPESLKQVLPDTTITLTFDDGDMNGMGGCNSYVGSYQTNGRILRVGTIASGQKACPTDIITQETDYFVALQNAKTFNIVEQQLRILYQDPDSNDLGFLLYTLDSGEVPPDRPIIPERPPERPILPERPPTPAPPPQPAPPARPINPPVQRPIPGFW